MAFFSPIALYPTGRALPARLLRTTIYAQAERWL
jgi:hypothetical protein